MTLDVLQDRIGYRFKDESLLVLAVTHSSWANEHSAGNAHNERLEFLGDAVLEIAVSAQLFARFPDAREGELTRLRSSLVNEATLAVIARKLHLDDCLRLARGEENQGGRQRDSLLSDAMEAVFGGVFVDGGIEKARAVVERLYTDRSSRFREAFRQVAQYSAPSPESHSQTAASFFLLPPRRRFRSRWPCAGRGCRGRAVRPSGPRRTRRR